MFRGQSLRHTGFHELSALVDPGVLPVDLPRNFAMQWALRFFTREPQSTVSQTDSLQE